MSASPPGRQSAPEWCRYQRSNARQPLPLRHLCSHPRRPTQDTACRQERAPCPARHVFDSRNMSAARQAPTASYEHEVPIDIFHLVDISSTRTGIVLRVKTSQTALEQTE